MPAGERMVFTLMRCAVACLLLTLLGGALAVLFYIPPLARHLHSAGLSFQNLRPIHTTFASAWIFLGGITCVFHYLHNTFGEMTAPERRRFRFQMICWGLAGLGIAATLPFGLGSGREYLGFHPAFSLLIIAGWVAFAVTFFGRVRQQFWERPVYVYMWATGILFFLYTFSEGHAWLIPGIRNHPIVDLQIQWKHCGTVVAAFNMLIYGSLMYMGETLSGDKTYARSTKGFAFMGIGMLNSFTNYAHHTYHLPQNELIKWIAFVVSMLEIILLIDLFFTVRRSLKTRNPTDHFTFSQGAMTVARHWVLGLLLVAILISIPPLNSFIHGTHVVMAHAMGSEIGIDSLIVFAVIAFVLETSYKRCWMTQKILSSARLRRSLVLVNRSLVALFLWLLIHGSAVAWCRAYSLPVPDLIREINAPMLVLFGLAHALALLRLTLHICPLLWEPGQRRIREYEIYPTEFYRAERS